MRKTSEWVSVGHPDKVADYISCYLLDRYLECDPMVRYAVEVQIKDKYVTLGGEVTSKANFTEAEIASFVRAAVNEIGYTAEYKLGCGYIAEYKQGWGKENTICGDELIVEQHIGKQSPDIAQGVDADGWGDQGIFWGMAVNSPKTGYMPADYYLAKSIGMYLYRQGLGGVDIKTQVTMLDGKPEEVVVAIPMLPHHNEGEIIEAVRFCCGDESGYKLTINGTGKFEKHGPVGDCGTTGRKLAVDFYGGNCVIGGGSPWTKDGTKADLTLNLYAREKAVELIKSNPELEEVRCAISCRIGSPEILVVMLDKAGNELKSYRENVRPVDLIEKFRLREPRFADMCVEGLFA